jgi:hypothetical protein
VIPRHIALKKISRPGIQLTLELEVVDEEVVELVVEL